VDRKPERAVQAKVRDSQKSKEKGKLTAAHEVTTNQGRLSYPLQAIPSKNSNHSGKTSYSMGNPSPSFQSCSSKLCHMPTIVEINMGVRKLC
jgi:hypothetical protein